MCVAVLLLIMQGIQRRLAECGHLWAYTDEMYTDSTEFYRYHPRYITPNRFRNLQKGLALTIRLLTEPNDPDWESDVTMSRNRYFSSLPSTSTD